MCGIVGIVFKDTKRLCSESSIVSMRDELIHRGPDDEGSFVEGNVGLGHRRLSIIDLAGGHQPMANEDASIWIVYNGEIYNFKPLREELIRKGHVFKTKSDTETILHLYEEKGCKCVDFLNGMFAFAIWDKKNKSLFLARDRMGIKPLYYVQTKEAFLFASEIKSLFKSGELQSRCNDQAIIEYFIFRDVAGERTLFKDVSNLLPGHTLILENGKVQINQYWSPFPSHSDKSVTLDQAFEELSYLIEDAVKIRMMSDVPLGTFCSGGIDSSLVTAIASKFTNHSLNTFSVGFHEKEYDETSYAQLVSQKYKTNHHEIKLNNKEFAELLPEMIWHNDGPLNFANSIQIYALSKLSKEYVTVVLTGEGADELFAGYPRYQIPRLILSYQKRSRIIRKLLDLGFSLFKDHRIEKLRQSSKYSKESLLMYNSSFLDLDFMMDVLLKYKYSGFSFREKCIARGESLNLDPITNLSILDQRNFLLSILNRQDKMSMAASIESRIPFLDHRIVEFSNSLPPSFKIKHTQGKYILKKIAGNYLPEKIINRKKSGFGVPLDKWLGESNGIGLIVDELLDDASLTEYFDKRRIEEIISEHKSGLKNHSEFLWAAINFKIWRKQFTI